MYPKPDYLIVGSGITGSVIARMLADSGCTVQIVDRRRDIGGNVHDHIHESGIRIHSYGPHLFHTSSKRIWDFVNTYSDFYKFENHVKTYVDGNFETWPIQESYISQHVGKSWKPLFTKKPANFEQACLGMMPELVYTKFVKGYTEKQWGVPATSLEPGLARRFDIRQNNDQRFCTAKWQGLPKNGYRNLVSNLLQGIPVVLDFDYLKNRNVFNPAAGVIFTGPIDEFFDFEYGKLAYRSQRREQTFSSGPGFLQPASVINNPSHDQGAHVRSIEWKQFMPAHSIDQFDGTVITTETPYTPINTNDYEYPFPDTANRKLYKKYASRLKDHKKLLVCGRLGEYRYYDMDQAIARALMLSKKLLREREQKSY